MNYATLASGIEAATVAWQPLGWEPLWFSEIEPFACTLLDHYYDVPNLGDMNEIRDAERADLIMAGTPCQSFSIAGLRKGMDDPRGNLTLVFLGIVNKLRPTWVVWENVYGVLSSNEGRDFGTILGALGQLGYGWAYRVLDAQYFGVAQRRRRVFVVGYLGDWRRAAAVLFERESLSGHPAPSREKGEAVAGTLGGGSHECGWNADFDRSGAFIPETSRPLAGASGGANDENRLGAMITAPLGHKPYGDSLSRESLLVPEIAKAFNPAGHNARSMHCKDSHIVPVGYRVHSENSVAMQGKGKANVADEVEKTRSLDTMGGYTQGQGGNIIQSEMAVRRLTPLECERLMDLPDNYTRISYRGKPAEKCPDGPRYRALGNSIVVSVMEWIGKRIEAVERIEA